jgi:hypothetical protein
MSALSRQEAWTYYFSKYLTSPGYPLPVCHFSGAQLQQLERQVLPAIFARCVGLTRIPVATSSLAQYVLEVQASVPSVLNKALASYTSLSNTPQPLLFPCRGTRYVKSYVLFAEATSMDGDNYRTDRHLCNG